MSTRRLYTLDDLNRMPAPQWMIEGLFERNSLVMVAGAPGSFKSFLALDWIMHMAAGRPWLDRKTEQSKCLYILGEGKASLLKRINAWCIHHRVTNDEVNRLRENMRITFDVPQFASRDQLNGLLSDLAGEAFVPDVVVIDTFARSFVNMDENSSKDTGLWISAAEHLRSLDYTVVFLHHTRKNSEFGVQFRGSTAISGAMDTIMTVVRDWSNADEVEVRVTKQKDHDEGPPLHFSRRIIPLDLDPKGSCVLVPIVKGELELDDDAIKLILADPTVEKTLGKQGEALAAKLNISKHAAKSRVARYLKRHKPQVANAAAEDDVISDT